MESDGDRVEEEEEDGRMYWIADQRHRMRSGPQAGHRHGDGRGKPGKSEYEHEAPVDEFEDHFDSEPVSYQ